MNETDKTLMEHLEMHDLLLEQNARYATIIECAKIAAHYSSTLVAQKILELAGDGE